MQFVERNASLMAAARVPTSSMSSVTAWDDFLMHGYVGDSGGVYDSSRLGPEEYAALTELTENYFAAGYEFFTPMALRFEDQEALRRRFDARG
jgi:hypothetical protein